MTRDTLTDRQWERLQPLLPPQKPKTGHPAKDHRLVLNGILWVLRTGAPWRDAPPAYGPWQTLSTRFYRWVKAASGTASLPNCSGRAMRKARWIGTCTTSMAV